MNEQNTSRSNKTILVLKNIWIIVIAAIATSLIIGSCVYMWQKSILKSSEKYLQTEFINLQNQTSKLRPGLEQDKTVTSRKESEKQDSQKILREINLRKINTANFNEWKIYNNTKFGYSISYPSDWEAKEYDENEVYISYPGWRYEMPEGGDSVKISAEDKTLEQFIKEYNTSDTIDGETTVSKIIKQENYIIDNTNAYKLVGATAIGLDAGFIFVPHDNKVYIIGFQDYDDVHLKIIETFKFKN